MHTLITVVSFVLLAAGTQAWADDAGAPKQKPGKGPAFTEPPKNDANYPLMGEFIGEIAAGEGEPEMLGLQIRALAGGEFDALSFRGGLPGTKEF